MTFCDPKVEEVEGGEGIVRSRLVLPTFCPLEGFSRKIKEMRISRKELTHEG